LHIDLRLGKRAPFSFDNQACFCGCSAEQDHLPRPQLHETRQGGALCRRHAKALDDLLPVPDIIHGAAPDHARKPLVWMRKNDVCDVKIEGIGVLRNFIADERGDSSPPPIRH
jgi:hypothetical protein